MSVEVTVKFKCDGCGKRIDAAATVKQGRRRQYYEVPNVFIVDNNMGDPENGEDSLMVYRNVSDGSIKQTQEDDESYLACSPTCVVKLVTKCMGKLK